jgi:predicted DNA binding CopG/RHH family protein
MTKDRWDTLLEQDWSESWDSLPEAPELVPRPASSQVTLRLSPSLLARIKRVAKARSLPYHALARSWLVDAMRHSGMPDEVSQDTDPQTTQLNIKLDQALLDALKERGHELGLPYHRVARERIAWETAQAEAALGFEAEASHEPPIKELMVLLLHAPNGRGDSTVRGMTRLQKLLFVIEKKLEARSSFYAFNYGPFNEEVNDAARALQVAGFIRSAEPTAAGPPSFKEMMSAVAGRAGPDSGGSNVVVFSLSDSGHEAAERLRKSSPVYEQLYAFVESIKKEWDTPDVQDLIARVYETWPSYAEKSVIRGEIESRAKRRRSS